MERQPSQDYRDRRERLAKQMNGGTLLLFAPLEPVGGNALTGYIPDRNFFYLTGWSEPGAALMVQSAAVATDTEPSHPYREILFLPKRNIPQERWTGAKAGPDSPEVSKFGFGEVKAIDAMRDELAASLPPVGRQVIYSSGPALNALEPADAAGIEWLRRANAFSDNQHLLDVTPLLGELRKVKDAGEMKLIVKATDASVAAHRAALRAIDAGVSERSLAALMQYETARRGCEQMAYAPIVGAGINSTTLHYSALTGTARTGDLVVMDVAGEYSLYASDITRTAPVSGRFTARQREIYQIVLGAQEAAMAAFVSGQSTLGRKSEHSLYQVAFNYINTHGNDRHGKPLGVYFTHGLSHFIGLDVHDAGDIEKPLQPGSVFSIEPGIYLPEEQIGVRIEDIFWVDPSGKLINLSGALPRKPDEIEAAMKH